MKEIIHSIKRRFYFKEIPLWLHEIPSAFTGASLCAHKFRSQVAKGF